VNRQVLIGVAALVLAGLALGAGLGLGWRYYLRPPAGPAPEAGPSEPHPEYPLAAPPPRLRLATWDFGTSLPGKEMRHRFEIANPGPEPWTLLGVTSTCTCTVGELPSKTVRPGETAWLEVTFRAPPRDGKVSGHVMVEFAEPGPLFQLMIAGEVRGLLAVDPPDLVFDYPPPGTRPSRTVRLHNRGDRDVKITRVEAPEWLRAEVRPADAPGPAGRPGQAWELVVQADVGKLRTASGSATLAVHTDTAPVGPAYLPVRLEAALEATPDRLPLGTVKPGAADRKRVLLKAGPGLGELTEKDLVVTHDLGDELDVQVHKEKSPRQFALSVRFQPKRARGEVEGELVIKTRKGGFPPVRVPVSAWTGIK
jgi:hypothetical protein